MTKKRLKKRTKRVKRKAGAEVRQMVLEDLSEVWHIGEKVFASSKFPYTYRTWNVDELLSLFYSDPELCLVAEHTISKKILGFALGTMLKRPYSPWTYGYFVWCGVRKAYQKARIGRRLYKELEKCFKEKGARIAIADIESTNKAAIRFVKKMDFKEAQTYVWLSKSL